MRPANHSLATFELKAQGSETKLVFDHKGFPSGEAAHLAEGWRINYWEPLAKFLLASGSVGSPTPSITTRP